MNSFPNLIHFMFSHFDYMKEKGIPLVGFKYTPPPLVEC